MGEDARPSLWCGRPRPRLEFAHLSSFGIQRRRRDIKIDDMSRQLAAPAAKLSAL